MIKNYIKIALRSLIRNKIFSTVTIAGFAIGIAACILIVLLILDTVSYDRFHEHADRIYRTTVEFDFWGEIETTAISSPPIGPRLTEHFAEIEDFVRLRGTRRPLVGYGDKLFYENRLFYADESIFTLFTFPLVHGDPETALGEPYSVVITENMARKYFGDDDPLHRYIEIDQETYTVTGVARNAPHNSHIQFDFLLSYATLPYHPDNWTSLQLYTFVLLREGVTVESVQEQIKPYVERNVHLPDWMDASIINFPLQPLTSIYLYSDLSSELSDTGMIRYIYFYIAIAICILLVACINYMNLSTARYTKRTREIGLRKVLGAERKQLIRQFLGETFVLTFLAFIFALVLVELSLPRFENLVGKTISIQYFESWYTTGLLLLLMIWIAVLAGVYPALFLSSFKTLDILRNKPELGRGRIFQLSIRRCLVVVQFILAIGLISGTILISNQVTYMRTAHLGFDKEHVVFMQIRDSYMIDRRESFKHELLDHVNILNVAASSGVPGRITRGHPVHPEGIEYDGTMRILSVDFNYIDLFDMEMAAGRPFLEELVTDMEEAFILNEAAAREFGWMPSEEAIGKRFSVSGIGGVTRTGQIVGVISDFHFTSLQNKIQPLVIMIYPTLYNSFAVKMSGDNIPGSIRFLESKWEEFVPHRPFEYNFLDNDFDRLYRSEMQTANIVGSFTFFVIFISCLGLLGLSTFTVEQRTKEISIRKVLGAPVGSIVQLLTIEFVKLIIIAGIIATPITYYLMQKWLENFAYRIDNLTQGFLIAMAITLLLSLLTVGFQTIKAAFSNPVENLRYE